MGDKESESLGEKPTFSTVVIDCGLNPDGVHITYELVNFHVGAKVVWKINSDEMHPALRCDILGPFFFEVIKVLVEGHEVVNPAELGRTVEQVVRIEEVCGKERRERGEDVLTFDVCSSYLHPISIPQKISDPLKETSVTEKIDRKKEEEKRIKEEKKRKKDERERINKEKKRVKGKKTQKEGE